RRAGDRGRALPGRRRPGRLYAHGRHDRGLGEGRRRMADLGLVESCRLARRLLRYDSGHETHGDRRGRRARRPDQSAHGPRRAWSRPGQQQLMGREGCLFVRAQIVLGQYDEDGNLTGTRVWPAPERLIEIYYPFSARLQEWIDRAERDARESIPE